MCGKFDGCIFNTDKMWSMNIWNELDWTPLGGKQWLYIMTIYDMAMIMANDRGMADPKNYKEHTFYTKFIFLHGASSFWLILLLVYVVLICANIFNPIIRTKWLTGKEKCNKYNKSMENNNFRKKRIKYIQFTWVDPIWFSLWRCYIPSIYCIEPKLYCPVLYCIVEPHKKNKDVETRGVKNVST